MTLQRSPRPVLVPATSITSSASFCPVTVSSCPVASCWRLKGRSHNHSESELGGASTSDHVN